MSPTNPPEDELDAELDRLRRRVAELEDLLAGRREQDPPRSGGGGSDRIELDAERILDLSGVMFVAIGADERVTLANKTACQILECPAEDLVGANWFDVFLPPDIREQVRDAFNRILAGELEALEYYENPVVSRGGATRLIAWHNALLAAGDGEIVGTLSSGLDVTEHRRAVEALRESEERFRTLFDSAHDGLLVADATTRRLVTGNRAIQAMLGYSMEELLQLSVDDIHPASDLPRVVSAFERQLRGELRVARDLPVKRKDGTVLRADISAAQVTVGGRLCLLGDFHDITDQKRDEEHRRQLEAKVREAQRLESLGVLAGGIAHDFNNLLVGILGNADLTLPELPQGSPAAERLTAITTAARRAADLCGQMLAYSGRGRFVVTDLDPSELVREMADLLAVSVSKRTTLVYDLEEGLPTIRADATQLRQVVMNLITNASEALAGADGVVTVRTTARRCDREELAATHVDDGLPAGEYVLLEVADTGCGLDPNTRERIFEPFFTTKVTGRGLGLAAALGIVRSHRGAVRIETEAGRGSSFTVFLPAARRPSAHAGAPRVDAAPGWRGSGLLLLADDEDAVRLVCRQMLERLGFEVIEATDGMEVLALLARHPEDVVCVVLDLSMPRMGGEAALQELRTLRPDLPVLMASGYALPAHLELPPGPGPFAFIQKPYRSQELTEKLRSLLEARPPP